MGEGRGAARLAHALPQGFRSRPCLDIVAVALPIDSHMGKKRPVSLLKRERAAEQEARPGKKRRKQSAPAQRDEQQHAPKPRHHQQQQPAATSGGGRRQAAQPPGLRPVSAVHAQAAYAVRRLLEADASKQGGATLKALTLGNERVAAKDKKVRWGVGLGPSGVCLEEGAGWERSGPAAAGH